MLRKIGYGLAAIGVVLVCSAEVRAQQHRGQHHGQYRGQVVTNRTVVNNTNVYNGGGYGGGYRGGYYNNGVGAWPGSGPYDSAIAVAGIVAGASVLNNVISSSRPQVPVYGGYPRAPVYVQPRDCITAVTGYDVNRNPIYGTYCR